MKIGGEALPPVTFWCELGKLAKTQFIDVYGHNGEPFHSPTRMYNGSGRWKHLLQVCLADSVGNLRRHTTQQHTATMTTITIDRQHPEITCRHKRPHQRHSHLSSIACEYTYNKTPLQTSITSPGEMKSRIPDRCSVFTIYCIGLTLVAAAINNDTRCFGKLRIGIPDAISTLMLCP